MNLSRRSCLPFACCVLLGVLASGCGGSKTVKVRGQVTNGGKPIPVQTQGNVEHLLIVFQPISEGAERAESSKKRGLAPVEVVADGATGKFEATVPPGKYRVCVIHFAGVDADKLEGKFGRDKSPVVRTITGNDEINIDVSKPNG